MMPNHQVLVVITIQEQLTDFFYIPVDRRRAAPHDNFLFKSRLLQQGFRYILGTLVKVILIIICVQVMWIMDKVFKFTNFGVVSWMHDDFFILAGRDHRDTSLVHLKRHLSEVRSLLKWPYTKQTILISGVHPQAEEVFSGVS